MTVTCSYRMDAAEGQTEALRTALSDLARFVRPFDGCEGIMLLQDSETPSAFTFIERWTDVVAHKAAGAAIGEAVFAPVMAALAKPPEGSYLDELLSV